MLSIKDVLIGTAIGDIVGSRFEIVNCKTGKVFDFFHPYCRFTDDTVMAFAVANALTISKDDLSDLKENTINSMVEIGLKYPDCGYGGKFAYWLISKEHKPYESFGNGSAMRISPVGVLDKEVDELKSISDIVTNVSHNHIDSTTAAQAVVVAIHMALNKKSKDEIKEYINNNYFDVYDLKKDEMKIQYFHINAIETVKQSLSSFFESNSFEDSIRNAISLGGDSDTIAAITGGIAAAYYGIPKDIYDKAFNYLDDYLINIHDEFIKKYKIKE